MTQSEWDRHERNYCSKCRYDRSGRGACPIKARLHANPSDELASKPLRRLGRCSQYAEKPSKQLKKPNRK